MTVRTAEPTGDLLIGSTDTRGPNGTIRAMNPRTGRPLSPGFGLGGPDEVEAAVRLAWEAFDTYRATDPRVRSSFLESIAAEIEAVAGPLVSRVVEETGIPAPRAQGELARTTNQLRLFASVLRDGSYLGVRIDPAIPDRTPAPRPDLRQRQIPIGPVAVFAASNFPLAFSVAGGDTASALAAGCPVVVKGHSAHPGVSEIVGRAVRAAVEGAGLPEGTFSLLLGDGRGLGRALVAHPHIRAVGFTGSRSAGLSLIEAAQGRTVPIPVYAEMSSVNPVFLLPGALAARGARIGGDFIASMTTGCGQLCTSPGLVFALGGEGYEDFRNAASEAVTASASAPMLTQGIGSAYTDGVRRLAEAPGVVEVAAGMPDDSIAVPGRARLFETDIEVFRANPQLQEEVFGAASLIVRVRRPEDFVDVARGLEGQLTATLHAEPEDYVAAASLLPELELTAGRVLVNGWPTGVEVGHAIVHGGPFPATSAPTTTSVGSRAIERFLRPVSYQGLPPELLPPELQDSNPLGLWRQVDGELERH